MGFGPCENFILKPETERALATRGFEWSTMINQGWISLFQDPPEPPPLSAREIQLRSGSAEVGLSGDSVLPKCAAPVNACGETAKPLPGPGELWEQNRT